MLGCRYRPHLAFFSKWYGSLGVLGGTTADPVELRVKKISLAFMRVWWH